MQDGPRWGKNGVTILYVMNVMILRYILFSLMCYFPMKMPSQKFSKKFPQTQNALEEMPTLQNALTKCPHQNFTNF